MNRNQYLIFLLSLILLSQIELIKADDDEDDSGEENPPEHSGSGNNSGSSASGVSGASGTSGTSGASGTSGTSDASGTSGTSDASGASGTSGTSGTSGASGASGTTTGSINPYPSYSGFDNHNHYIRFSTVESYSHNNGYVTFSMFGKVLKGLYKKTTFTIIMVIGSLSRTRTRNLEDDTADCEQKGDSTISKDGETLADQIAEYTCKSNKKYNSIPEKISLNYDNIDWKNPDFDNAVDPAIENDNIVNHPDPILGNLLGDSNIKKMISMSVTDTDEKCSLKNNKLHLDLEGKIETGNGYASLDDSITGEVKSKDGHTFTCTASPSVDNNAQLSCDSEDSSDPDKKITIEQTTLTSVDKAFFFNLKNVDITCKFDESPLDNPLKYYGGKSASGLSTGGIVAIIIVCVVVVLAIAFISFTLKKKSDNVNQNDFNTAVDSQARIGD